MTLIFGTQFHFFAFLFIFYVFHICPSMVSKYSPSRMNTACLNSYMYRLYVLYHNGISYSKWSARTSPLPHQEVGSMPLYLNEYGFLWWFGPVSKVKRVLCDFWGLVIKMNVHECPPYTLGMFGLRTQPPHFEEVQESVERPVASNNLSAMLSGYLESGSPSHHQSAPVDTTWNEE